MPFGKHGDGSGSGFKEVDRLPADPRDGDAFFVEADYATGLDFQVRGINLFGRDVWTGYRSQEVHDSGDAPGLAVGGSITPPSEQIAAFYNNNTTNQAVLILREGLVPESIFVDEVRYHVSAPAADAELNAAGLTLHFIFGFSWGVDLATLTATGVTVRLQLRDGSYVSRSGGTGPADERDETIRSGYYIAENGRYRFLGGAEPVDLLPLSPDDGKLAYVVADHDVVVDTRLHLDTAVDVAEADRRYFLTDAGAAVSGGFLLNALPAGGSMEGSSGGIEGVMVDPHTEILVVADEDLTLGAIIVHGRRRVLTEVALNAGGTVRSAGLRVWDYDSVTLLADFGLTEWSDFDDLSIRIEDSAGNFLTAQGDFQAEDAVRESVEQGLYLAQEGVWTRIGGKNLREITAETGNPANRYRLEDNEAKLLVFLSVNMQRGSSNNPKDAVLLPIPIARDLLTSDIKFFGAASAERNSSDLRRDRTLGVGASIADGVVTLATAGFITANVSVGAVFGDSGGAGATRGLAEGLAAERAARLAGDQAEATARTAADTAERNAREAADRVLTDAVAALDTRQRREAEETATNVADQAELDAIPVADGRFHWAFVVEDFGTHAAGDVLIYIGGTWRAIPASLERVIREAQVVRAGTRAELEAIPVNDRRVRLLIVTATFRDAADLAYMEDDLWFLDTVANTWVLMIRPSTNEVADWARAGQTRPSGETDLSIANRDGDSLDLASSTGRDATIPSASETEAGLQSAADKVKLSELERRIADLETGGDSGTHMEPDPDPDSGTRPGAGQYLAAKAAKPFVAADFTGAYGIAYEEDAHTAEVANIGENRWFFAVARLATSPDPSFCDVNRSGFNQFSDVTEQARVTLGGNEYRVWSSDYSGR